MSQLVRQQDLPPPGGYKPIPYQRIPAKVYFGGFTAFAAFVGISSFGLYLYTLNRYAVDRQLIEMRSSKMAIFPLLLAERDRKFLKQINANRRAEEELMKDVPGWEVGTWYGERVYTTVPKDEFITPGFYDFYAHADEDTLMHRLSVKWRS